MLVSIVQTLNNESTIEDCLKSLIPLGPIYVFDSGSQDNTKALAQGLGATVVDNPGVGYKDGIIQDFSEMRNWSIKWVEMNTKASYALFVDSDEYVRLNESLPPLIEPFYLVSYKTQSLSWEKTGVIKLRKGIYYQFPIHETLPPSSDSLPITISSQGKPKSPLLESGHQRNLRITRREYVSGNRSPRILFYYANELREQGILQAAAQVYREYIPVSCYHDEKMKAYLYLARCLRYSMNHKAAEEVLWEALSIDGRFSELYVEMSYLCWDLGEMIKSKAFAQMAIRPIPKTNMFIEEKSYLEEPKRILSFS